MIAQVLASQVSCTEFGFPGSTWILGLFFCQRVEEIATSRKDVMSDPVSRLIHLAAMAACIRIGQAVPGWDPVMNLYLVGSSGMPIQLSHGGKHLVTANACTLMDSIIRVKAMEF